MRFALSEIDARGICINVKNSSATRRGRAYSRMPSILEYPVRFPLPDHGGHRCTRVLSGRGWGSYTRRNGELVKRRGGRWPAETLGDWREALVSVAAHEAKHIEQFRTGTSRRRVQCHHFAASVLRRYRGARGVDRVNTRTGVPLDGWLALNRTCRLQREGGRIRGRGTETSGRMPCVSACVARLARRAVAVVAAVGTASIAGAAAPPKFQVTVNDIFLPGGGIQFVVQPRPDGRPGWHVQDRVREQLGRSACARRCGRAASGHHCA